MIDAEHITSTKEADEYQRYFTEFLPGIIGRQLIAGLKGLNCQVAIRVTDLEDPDWFLVVEQGCLAHVDHDGPEPACRFELNVATLVEVITARRTPQDAFFSGDIQITGDIEQGLQLSTVLEEFFERFPYGPETPR